MELLMTKLRLIFAETHDDITTVRILNAITPQLKERGYNVYFDEIPQALTKTELVEQLETGVSFFSQMSVFFKPESKEMKKLENGKALLQLITTLEKQNIDYKAIDPLDPMAELTNEEYESLQPERDKGIAAKYLSTESVFGRVGLAHLKGIQENIITEIGLNKATQEFQFFHIYTESLNNPLLAELKSLPINVTLLDGNKLSDNNIIEKIIEELGNVPEFFLNTI
jgi:hypothetical protein